MDDLLKELETLKISDNFSDQNSWKPCIDLIQRSFVPPKFMDEVRPCEEKDFREYKLVVEKKLNNVRFMLQHILNNCKQHLPLNDNSMAITKTFSMNLLLLIGEHSEKNIWNTAECVNISKELSANFCHLWACQSISTFFSVHENFNKLLLMLRPKLLKMSWKVYPAAITCYKWMIYQVEKPLLYSYIRDVLPTTLILIDDYVPDNILIGLQCLHLIIQHSHMKHGFLSNGHIQVIYHSLKLLTYRKEVKYIILLYTCLANLLPTIEYWSHRLDWVFEWTKRDEILSNLIDNMAFEQNIELRHAYMCSLPQFLTNMGCGKWCEALTRILVEYCEHHTDLRTLKATLETAKAFLMIFHLRVAAHCVDLYTAFLKLHFDLTETPVFDREIMQNLEDCICLLYERSQNVGRAVLNDDRMRQIFSSTMPIGIHGDITYFE